MIHVKTPRCFEFRACNRVGIREVAQFAPFTQETEIWLLTPLPALLVSPALRRSLSWDATLSYL